MLSMVARRTAQAGAIGLRQFGTRSQPKNQGFRALKVSDFYGRFYNLPYRFSL